MHSGSTILVGMDKEKWMIFIRGLDRIGVDRIGGERTGQDGKGMERNGKERNGKEWNIYKTWSEVIK